MTELERIKDFNGSIHWARRILSREKAVIIDTETTGLDKNAEIIELAIITVGGVVLLNQRLKPTQPIPPEATAIHGIKDSDVEKSPTFKELNWWLTVIFGNVSDILIYNADYDNRLLKQTANLYGLAEPLTLSECVMKKYAEFCGDYNEEKGSYRWQKLPSGDHSALGDCFATLKVLKAMAMAEPIL